MEHNHLTIKTYMAIMAERDAAVRERSMALEERKRAFAERDMAMLQRDAAIAERNVAVSERNEAMSALHFRENSMNAHNMTPPDSPPREKYLQHHQQQMHHAPHFLEASQNPRETPTSDKPKKVKQAKEKKESSAKKSKTSGKSQKESEFSNYQGTPSASNGWKNEQDLGSDGEDLDRDLVTWKDDLGLNQIDFDDSSMPVPVCSCTGSPQPCYKWGNGGWQSACCTITMSMYPLPQSSNKRHARVGGRKMSGGVFTKLLNRLASEGHDLYSPVDLKDHWSKHGTNRYSSQK